MNTHNNQRLLTPITYRLSPDITIKPANARSRALASLMISRITLRHHF
jgi:hypothetical protein